MSKILNDNLKEYKVSEIPHARLMGRNVKGALKSGKPVPLFWGASCIEVRAASSEVWALVETDYASLEVWACVWVNGRIISRFMLEKGKNWVCLCRGFSAGTVNTVRLMRDSQAMSEDPEQVFLVHSFAIEKSGAFQPLKEKKLRIEFVGDSVTSGEGLYGAVDENQWISAWISPSKTYAVKAAEALDAEFSLVSACGWGIVSAWDNNIQCVIPPYYEQICGICKGEPQQKLGACAKFDFAEKPSDIIIVNLGANDHGAFFNPPWIHDGKEYKMHMNSDGTFDEADCMKVSCGIRDFLKVIRKNNPQAKICWVWGMLEMPELETYMHKGVSMYIAESGDKNVDMLILPPPSLEREDEDKGSRNHPGPLTHKLAAAKIIDYCKGLL